MIPKRNYSDFYEISRGINTVKTAVALSKNEVRDAQDVDLFPDGGFSKRNGYTVLNAVQATALSCTGLYMARYSTAGGTNIALLVSGASIFSMSSALDGTWVNITGSLTITAGPNNIWNFAMLNDLCILGNGTDSPIKVNSSGAAAAHTAGLPFSTFKFPVESRGYMWYFVPTVGGNVLYDRGYFSDVSDPTTVGSNNFINIAKGHGGDIQGAIEYKTFLYVFKRHAIYQIVFQPTQVDSSGNAFPWITNPNPVIPGVGTQSHRSIVKFTTPTTHDTPGEEYVFFVDQSGIPRIFDGSTTFSFGSVIGTSRDTAILSLSDMDRTRNPYCFSINYAQENMIFCFMSQSNSQQDVCWVLDYNNHFSIMRYSYARAFNVGAVLEKSNGNFKPYVGDYSGRVFELDQGTTDSTAPINDYIRFGDTFVGSPASLNKWRNLNIRGSTGSTTQKIKVSYYVNGDTTAYENRDSFSLQTTGTQWGAFIWGQDSWAKNTTMTKSSEINLEAQSIGLKVESVDKTNDTYSIEGFSLESEPAGMIYE